MEEEDQGEERERFSQFGFEEWSVEEDTESQNPRREKREICFNGCGRPANVCLCNHLPSQPLSTSTQVVILQHPHELRHKLATVPILKKCLLNCETLVGRRLRHGSSPILDSLFEASSASSSSSSRNGAVFLFPGTDSLPSVELEEWVSLNFVENLVLIVFDGTWKHAKEMVSASLPFVSKFATRVSLNYDVGIGGGTIFDSELILRREPFSGCMSTVEAVARSLRVLEMHNNGIGVEIEEKLISVLKAMVQFQASYLNKPVKPRPRLLKRKAKKQQNKDEVIEYC